MKKIILSISLLVEGVFIQAQLQNPGFEKEESSFPVNWNSKPNEAYEIKIDQSIKHSGNNSLLISGKSSEVKGVQSFSQTVPISGIGFRKIQISAYIKSENTTEVGGLWCEVQDENKKRLDFGNSESQNNKVIPNSDWKKYSLEFLVNDDAKYFRLGGGLANSGKAWYDDFSITEIAYSQKPPSEIAKKYIKEFEEPIRQYSLYKTKIDWSKLDVYLDKVSKGMVTIEDTDPALLHIMKTLLAAGDNHSFIQSIKSTEEKNTSNPTAMEPEFKLLDHKIGYVMIPGFSSLNKEIGNTFSQKIQNMIKQLDSENKIKGWIVDLRKGSGGIMYPMIVGLGPLIGEGTLGYFVTEGQPKDPWIYKNGAISDTKVSMPYTIKNPGQKIAVLIGPGTASSSEATAISLIGKKNVKTFGQASAGFTTANESFRLSDGKFLYLAVSYEMDRTGKEYKGKIEPDVLITPSIDKNVDAEIQKASEWILE